MVRPSKMCSLMIKSLKCSKNDLRKRLPILQWIQSYNLEKLRGDIISGLAVGLMVVPQSLAIASLAGLPPQHGLYSSFPGVFMYCLLGTSKDLNVGPTVISALMADRYNQHQNPDVASLLAFTSGAALFLAGLLKLSFIVQFISAPVFSGFISAASIVIAVGQMKDLLGLKNPPQGFFSRLEHLFTNLKNLKPGDAILGILSLVFLITLHLIGKRKSKNPGQGGITIGCKVLKFVNIAKSALVVIIATIVAYVFYASGYPDVFTLAGELPRGLPKAKIPFKTIQISQNATANPGDLISSFGAGIGLVPLIMFIESIAVAKALAATNNYKVDASQELIALGISNIFGSFFSAFPFTGSLARSTINSVSGAATPATGVFCGIIVILAIQFITPVFKFIPMAVLAAMVTAAVLTLIDFRMPLNLWRVNRLELLPFAAAFCGCFYQLEIGILSGAMVSLAFMLYRDLMPRVAIVTVDNEPGVATLNINGGLWFPGTEKIVNNLEKIAAQFEGQSQADFNRVLIRINCENLFEMDYTAAMALKMKITELQAIGVESRLINVTSKHVKRIFGKIGLIIEETDRDVLDSRCKDSQSLLHETNV